MRSLCFALAVSLCQSSPLVVNESHAAFLHARWQSIYERLNETTVESTCAKDMRTRMPACHQFGSMWCWATGIAELTEYYSGAGPAQCLGLECQIVSWCPKPPTCQSHRGSTCCPLSEHKTCGTDGASLDMVKVAASHFTGRNMQLSSGPLKQADLDKKLQSGKPILMLVGDKTPYHVVSVGGCGGGSYYFHDPEWVAGRYEVYSYKELLKSSYYGYKWLDTVSEVDGSDIVV